MININGENWKILLVSPNHPSLLTPNNTYTLGCCDDNIKTIFITDDIAGDYLHKVLCHELVHACMYSYNIELNEYQEEILADLIATYGHEIMHMTNSIFKRLKDIYNK